MKLSQPPDIVLGDRAIGRDHPALIIAEIGTGHGGDLERGYQLIDSAAAAGADCVKFQTVFAEEIIHPRTGDVELPGGPTPLYEVFQRLERNAEFYARLKAHTESVGLLFLSSPFGVRSARLLRDIEVKAVKIASPEINHYPLLNEVATWGVPVIVSAGVSKLGDIEQSLARLPGPTAILHCVTAYPAPESEYNLRCIPTLSAAFHRCVGVSDHSLDPIAVPTLAVAMGGMVVEKHFTLDKTGDGLDDPVALTPAQFGEMVAAVRSVEDMDAADKLDSLIERYGHEQVVGILGDGQKKLADSEQGNYHTTNRSIIAIRDIAVGETLSPDNIALLRSEKNLSPGLTPEFLPVIVGHGAQRPIQSGHGIEWTDLFV